MLSVPVVSAMNLFQEPCRSRKVFLRALHVFKPSLPILLSLLPVLIYIILIKKDTPKRSCKIFILEELHTILHSCIILCAQIKKYMEMRKFVRGQTWYEVQEVALIWRCSSAEHAPTVETFINGWQHRYMPCFTDCLRMKSKLILAAKALDSAEVCVVNWTQLTMFMSFHSKH